MSLFRYMYILRMYRPTIVSTFGVQKIKHLVVTTHILYMLKCLNLRAFSVRQLSVVRQNVLLSLKLFILFQLVSSQSPSFRPIW